MPETATDQTHRIAWYSTPLEESGHDPVFMTQKECQDACHRLNNDPHNKALGLFFYPEETD